MADKQLDPLENYIIHPQTEEPNIEVTATKVFAIMHATISGQKFAEGAVYEVARVSRRTALILNGYLRHAEDIMEGPPKEYAIHLQYQKAPMKSATWNVVATNIEDAIQCAKKECKKKYKASGHCLSVNGEAYDDE